MAEPIHPCVYILASRRNGTLYMGVTRDLLRRMWMHRTRPSGFCARYAVTRLVWFGPYTDMTVAIAMEKRIKRWRRQWKIELIEQSNPAWRDLYCDLQGAANGSRLSTALPLRPG
jgi:putative endonuclease